MKSRNTLFDFILREWLLFASVLGLVATSLYLKRPPVFSTSEIQVLFLLWVLFVAVKGLENSGLISNIAQSIEKGRLIPLKLVAAAFFMSMVITNDIALIVIVPLTLSINTSRKDILVILEALAANAGSAFTPFGNPQNLFIYWFYHIDPTDFVTSIAPFSFFFLALLLAVSFVVKTQNDKKVQPRKVLIERTAYVYGGLLFVVVLTVFRVIPVVSGALVLAYAFVFNRKSLRVDYSLLLTFLCFFGLTENIRILLTARLEHSGHIFILSALTSQVMSNVPVALLFAKFTTQWKALLWGTNVGGYGNIMASFANIIAYKLYVGHESSNNIASFTIKFIGIGYVMFFVGMGLYWAIEVWF